ncbi:hypothetical protein [Nocardiopsis sp. HUAS JQ3]|uniref:hypothetical protein n=1 Tax=Nocardiopsis sp. HUAS JQ3 TaxID=3061629 RepID=UPI0023A9B4DE|nr:hypothetical protein [Nocardiopsis sp. HUAS JQ3]WDZ90607.1 hypothetical protein PV789_27590 [Nocardiopsis sp. HUAS JQ3]
MRAVDAGRGLLWPVPADWGVVVLGTALQAVLVVSVLATSKLVFDLPGMLPSQYFVASIAIFAACLPMAALRSGLSMLMRSFAAAVTVALLGGTAGVFLLMVQVDTRWMILPYGLISRATQTGIEMFAGSRTVPPTIVALLVAVALGATAVVVAVFCAVLDRCGIGWWVRRGAVGFPTAGASRHGHTWGPADYTGGVSRRSPLPPTRPVS